MNTSSYVEDDQEKIALFFSCRDLPKRSLSSGVGLYLMRFREKDLYDRIAHSEVIHNEPNPDFTTSFELDFIFETKQRFKVEVWEKADNGSDSLLLGQAVFELAEIAGALENLKIMNLKKDLASSTVAGKCIARMDKISSHVSYEISFDTKISNIPKFSFFSSWNSFLKISKLRVSELAKARANERDQNYEDLPNNQWLLIHTTSNLSGKNIEFENLTFKGSKLCNNDFNVPIKVELWKYKGSNDNYLLGKFVFKINDLISGKRDFTFNLVKTSEKTTMNFRNFKFNEMFSFTDFLRGGLSINLVVGIDFTASNKDPSDVNSLHYLKKGKLNFYQQAILSVGEILEKYNHTGKIPAYGFGAKIGTPPTLSHFFPLSFNYQNPFFNSFKELFDSYEKALSNMVFSGPTHFAPLLEKVIEFAKARFEIDPNNYTTFLLLTDGVINDLQATIDQIVKACHYPISIIIVGIGNEDFKSMDILDADDVPLVSSWGEKMINDIVQFVPFNKFANNPITLRQEVLEELPGQVVAYFKSKGIRPGKPRILDINSIGLNVSNGFINPRMESYGNNGNNTYPNLDEFTSHL